MDTNELPSRRLPNDRATPHQTAEAERWIYRHARERRDIRNQANRYDVCGRDWLSLQTRDNRWTRAERASVDIFEKNRDDAFINALALAVKKDLSVLDPDAAQNDDLATIFEEFAAGGFTYLDQYIKDTPGDVLENLLALIQQYRSSAAQTPVGLEGLDRSALEVLGDLEM